MVVSMKRIFLSKILTISLMNSLIKLDDRFLIIILGINDKHHCPTSSKDEFTIERVVEKIDLPREIPDLKLYETIV